MLKLNSIPKKAFMLDGSTEECARVKRNRLVALGREITTEYAKTMHNKTARKGAALYALKYEDGDYTTLSRAHKDDLFMFCAGRAYEAEGREAPDDVNRVYADASLSRNPLFLRTLAGITQEVITPVLPYVISDAAGMMMEWSTVPLGQTKVIEINSNDIFVFEDSAWGATRNVTKNYLYSNEITLNPSPKSCYAVIKWYQMVANETDIGWYYNAIIAGMYAKIMAQFNSALTAAIADTKYMPAYLKKNTFTSANYADLTTKVAEANHLRRSQLMVFGDYRALAKVLPTGTSADAALTYELGYEWMRNGYIGVAGGVPLYEMQNVMVPGTVNTTGTEVLPTDVLYIFGRPGTAYAPLYGAFMEGSPITVEILPDGAGNYSLDINVTAVFDIAPVFGSKVGVITNVQ